jgi:hypothetical protein
MSSAQGGQLIDNLAQRFGLSHEQMDAAVTALIPAISLALQNAASSPDSLQRVISAVTHTPHLAAYENPDAAYSDVSVAQGRDLVAHLFGSSAAAGQVAQLAARESGVRPDILMQLLTILAPIILGGLSKSFNSQGLGGILGSLASSGALGSLLDSLRGGAGAPAAPAPAAPKGGGLLGGLLSALLGSLLSGRSAPTPPPPPASPLPGGFDSATLQAALEKIKQTFQPGAAGASSPNSELEEVLSKVFRPTK